jgi:hypothetical protein
MDPSTSSPGAMLALMMRRRGWSAPRLAGIARGVSASSVRSYAADRSTPRPQQALLVANALGPKEGRTLLEAWGFTDLADGFYSAWREAMIVSDERITAVADEYYRFNKVEYPGEPLSEPGLRVLRAVALWMQQVEGIHDLSRRPGKPKG